MYNFIKKNEISLELNRSVANQCNIVVSGKKRQPILDFFDINYKYIEDEDIFDFDEGKKVNVVFNDEEAFLKFKHKKNKKNKSGWSKEIQIEPSPNIKDYLKKISDENKNLKEPHGVNIARNEEEIEVIIFPIYQQIIFEDIDRTNKSFDTHGFNNVVNVFSNCLSLRIPIFQRKYVWSVSQINQLLDDIYNMIKTNKHHYLGEVIIIGDLIIDGQQRLTTLGLLLYALDIIDVNKLSFVRDFDHRFNHEYNNQIKLLEDVKKGNEPTYTENSHVENLMHIIKRLNSNDIKITKDKLTKLMINVTYLSEKEYDAPVVYNSINNTGIPLKEFELIKTILFNSETMESYEARELNKYFDKKDKDLDDIFRYYCCIKFGKLPSKDEKSEKNISISKIYKEYIDKEYKGQFTKDDLMREKVEIEKWFDIITKVMNKEFGEDMETNSLLTWLIEVESEIIPLIAVILSSESASVPRITKALVAKMIRVLLRNESIGSYKFDKLSNNVYNRLKEKGEISSDYIIELLSEINKFSNITEEVLKYQKDISNLNAKHILALYNYTLVRTFEAIDTRKYHVEHIFPNNPQPSDIEKNPDYMSWVDKIGNKTLLSGVSNSGEGNKPFKEKKETYKEADFEITKELYEKYKNKDEFGKGQVEERTVKIIEKLLSEFNL